jgi:hypothetical protein
MYTRIYVADPPGGASSGVTGTTDAGAGRYSEGDYQGVPGTTTWRQGAETEETRDTAAGQTQGQAPCSSYSAEGYQGVPGTATWAGTGTGETTAGTGTGETTAGTTGESEGTRGAGAAKGIKGFASSVHVRTKLP